MKRTLTALVVAAIVAAAASTAAAMRFSGWGPAVNAESIPGTSTSLNTGALEGCPFVAPRDDILYFATDRAYAGKLGSGDLDIFYSLREEDGTWGDPEPFAAVNSAYDDFCPSPHRNGKDFLYVSERDGYCGASRNSDIYVTRLHVRSGWSAPQNLGCTVNSTANEASPHLLGDELYFSSTRSGRSEIYVSLNLGAATAVAELNDPSFGTFRPNLRRDGLEIFFDSNRDGYCGAARNVDLWTATRASSSDPWSAPVNLGCDVNSPAVDNRASLSWDGTTLYFGSNRTGTEGSLDVYVTTRAKLTGHPAG